MKTTKAGIEYEKPTVRLVGEDGNAFGIIGRVSRVLKRIDPKIASEFTAEAMSGDYDHVLQTCMEYVEVE
jgi:hypothetical protein